MVKSSDCFENGCIPMHCGARVVIQRLDLTFYSYKYFQQEDRATAARYVDVVIIIH